MLQGPSAVAETEPEALQDMKLLIIDDDDEIRELVRFSAGRQRVQISDASSGAEGVKKAEDEQPGTQVSR